MCVCIYIYVCENGKKNFSNDEKKSVISNSGDENKFLRKRKKKKETREKNENLI